MLTQNIRMDNNQTIRICQVGHLGQYVICEWHNTKARAWSRSDVLLLCWICWGLVRAGSKNGLKKWYLQAHLSILEYTCICILEQGSLWTRIAYMFFRRGRAWYPFSHGHDIIGKLQRRVWRTQNYCAKLLDPTFTWNEDLGMRTWEWDLIALNAVWYSIGIPPTHSQTICIIVCRQSILLVWYCLH